MCAWVAAELVSPSFWHHSSQVWVRTSSSKSMLRGRMSFPKSVGSSPIRQRIEVSCVGVIKVCYSRARVVQGQLSCAGRERGADHSRPVRGGVSSAWPSYFNTWFNT